MIGLGFFGGLSLLLVAGGILGVLDALSYTPDQRATVPRLWWTYFGGMVLALLVGVGAIVWVLVAGVPWSIHTVIVGGLGIVLPLIHHRIQQELGLDRSPLWDRLA